MRAADPPRKKRKAALLGLGLDNDDGKLRITHGPNFHLFGGSEPTHEQMQEKCIKLNEKLKDRGKELGELRREELRELAAECDMNVADPQGPGDGE